MMKILKIQVHNFLGLAAFKTNRLGKLNRITGDNGVGKSSVLKAIKEAFKSSGVDPELVKVNTDKAEIIIELDDKVLIERHLTAGSNNVKVTVDGQPMTSPQTWLNGLLGPFNFDPTAFFLDDAKKRRQRLLSAIPFSIQLRDIEDVVWPGTGEDSATFAAYDSLDLGNIDTSKHGLIVLQDLAKIVYDRRHEVGLDRDRQKKSIEQDKKDLGDTKGLERFKDYDITAKVEELTEKREANQANEADKKRLESLREQAEDKDNEIDRLKKRLVELEADLSRICNEGTDLKEKIAAYKPHETESLQKDVSEFHHYQKVLNRLEDIDRRQKEFEASSETYNALDQLHKALMNEVPKKLLEKINLPIDGLEIKGDNILINGVGLDKMATSEQMRFSIQIARSLAGKLKIMCIDRFESLGADARKAFEQEVKGDDFEYFISQVTSGPLAVESGGDEPEPENIQKKNKATNRARF